MKKGKKHGINKLRRRYHRFFFALGFAAGGVLGFSLREIADSTAEKLEKIKERRKSKKAKKAEAET